MKISLEQHLRDYAASFYNGQPENDRNIRLKIDHTFRVRDEARRIAAAELPDPAERSLAERAALLHDLSRFEQFARFGTFKDAASFDHGDRSAELAAEQHLLDDLDEAAQADVLDAIRSHNKLAIPGTLSERGTVLAQVVRDADKIDILRVNVETPMEEIYNVSTAALRRSPVTPAVLDAFYAHHCVLHSLKQYPADNAVGHASLVFELCYPESLRIVDEQGWLWRLLDFKTDNPDTAAAFAAIRDELHRWLNAQSA